MQNNVFLHFISDIQIKIVFMACQILYFMLLYSCIRNRQGGNTYRRFLWGVRRTYMVTPSMHSPRPPPEVSLGSLHLHHIFWRRKADAKCIGFSLAGRPVVYAPVHKVFRGRLFTAFIYDIFRQNERTHPAAERGYGAGRGRKSECSRGSEYPG